MSTFGFILGALLGVAFAVVLSLLLVATLVKKSNDWGDIEGVTPSMSGFVVLDEKDKIKKSLSLEEAKEKYNSEK